MRTPDNRSDTACRTGLAHSASGAVSRMVPLSKRAARLGITAGAWAVFMIRSGTELQGWLRAPA